MGFQNINTAKKSLGQNFFINNTLADKIVNYVKSNSDSENIIEIGPGKGFFTDKLINNFDKVYCIEKDDILATELKNKYRSIEIFNDDVLDFNWSIFSNENFAVYGSLPYNISKKIIQNLIENSASKNLFFIIQKEVAEKYINKDKKSSILSIMTELYCDVKIVLHISPSSFRPMPKVDSSFIHIKLNNNYLKIDDIKRFSSIVHQAFSSPRKKLKNNVKDIPQAYEQMRAEDLNLSNFIDIYNKMKMI